MKYVKTFEQFISEKYPTVNEEEIEIKSDDVNEGLLTIAGGVILGLLGLRLIKTIVKKTLGKIGMNLKVGPEKLKELVDKIFTETVSKGVSGNETMAMMLWKSEMMADIDSGEIKTINDILKSIENMGESVNEASEDSYSLHRMADNVGQEVAAEFLLNHKVDLELLKKAVQRRAIDKYELRDIINGNAQSSKLKKFMKEFVNEGKEKKLNKDLGNISGTFAEEDIKAADADFYDVKPGKYIKFYIEDVNNSTILKVKRIAKANGLKFAKDLDDMLLFKESVNEGSNGRNS